MWGFDPVRALLILALLPLPALAETPPADPQTSASEDAPLNGAEFDALTRGRTMDTYDAQSGLYGVETFLPGQKTIWRDAGKCTRGSWEQVGQQICFTYEAGLNNPVCWTYHDRGGWIEGWFRGDHATVPIQLREAAEPVACDSWLGS